MRITATIAAIWAAVFWSEAVLEAYCVYEAAGDELARLRIPRAIPRRCSSRPLTASVGPLEELG